MLPTASLPATPALWSIAVRNGVYTTAPKPFTYT
jgi:hypothetical protein